MQEIRELAVGKELSEMASLTFKVMVNKAAARGFLKGLQEEEFDMRYLPEDFQSMLENPNYQIHEGLWNELNEWECAEQAPLIFAVAREVHIARALNGIRTGEGPLGVLKGREHLALPIELAGKFHFSQMVKGLHPVLKRFGLDKGVVQDKTGGITYPWAIKCFSRKRRELFEWERLDNYDSMFRFIIHTSERIEDWPEELSEPFKQDWELVLDAINQVAVHYY